MRLDELKIMGFRGFNQQKGFTFSEGLNLIYAPNGYGKSSIAEAIEWLLFCDTSKLRYANSKLEFKDSLKNIHYEGSEKPFVEAILRMPSNSKIKIRRIYINDAKSELYIDDKPVENLDSLGIIRDKTPNPIVAQHALKVFINTEPANRWKIISSMLGLEILSSFRSDLSTAITKFKNQHENYLSNVKEIELKLVDEDTSSTFSNLIKHIRNFDQTGFMTELKKVTSRILELEECPENPLVALKDARVSLFMSLTELPKFISEAAPANFKTDVESIQEIIKKLLELTENYANIYPYFVASIEAKKTGERISLIKQGLQLITEGDPTCPLCGEQTITPAKREELRIEIQQHQRYLSLSTQIQQIKDHLIELVDKFIEALFNYLPINNFEQKEIELWLSSNQLPREITEETSEIVSKIETIKNLLVGYIEKLKEALASIEEDYRNLRINQDNVSNFAALIETGAKLLQDIEQLCEKIKQLYQKLIPIIQSKAIENEKVKIFDMIYDLWENLHVINKAFTVHTILERMLKLKEITEEFEKEKTADRLKERNTEIIKWYNILNPNEEIRFSRMGLKKGVRKIDLIAELYGKQASAAAMLSEAHINATGLSVYLSQIVSPYTPIKFILNFESPLFR